MGLLDALSHRAMERPEARAAAGWWRAVARWRAGVSVFVDDVRHQFGRMVMCHMWADSLDELFAMADRIGVQRKWLQQPPKASWVHFDISLGMKAKAIGFGAILTDRYGPSEHTARLRGNQKMLDMIASVRSREAAV